VSRVGSQVIIVPKEVTVEIKDNQVTVTGPKGKLSIGLRPEIKTVLKDGVLTVSRLQDSWFAKSLHGVSRTLIANMIEGVIRGFSKTLKVVGTGYRVKLVGQNLELTLGFSHPVVIPPPPGIKFLVEGNDLIKIEGIDNILVGKVTAEIRKVRPPEPYKGKGIRYLDEEVRKKAGKTVKAGTAEGGK
jgi:large subunit ribosomal protein L6